jgi:hypothetical protein
MTEARIVPPFNIQKSDILDLLPQAGQAASRYKPKRFFPAETWKKRQAGKWLLAQPLKLFHALCIKFAD